MIWTISNQNAKRVFFFSFISIYRRACVWPADVIDGNVSELLVHGRLVFFARQEIEGGLGVLIGDIYANFSRALKIEGQILSEKNILHKLKEHRGITEQVQYEGKRCMINNFKCNSIQNISSRGSINTLRGSIQTERKRGECYYQPQLLLLTVHFTLAENRKLLFQIFSFRNSICESSANVYMFSRWLDKRSEDVREH